MSAFYHGGASGLNIGDTLLPASALGVLTPSALIGADYEQDRVYLATDMRVARSFAALVINFTPGRLPESTNGTVYKVQPIGELLPDPDYIACWTADRALITSVIATNIRANPEAQPIRGQEPSRNDPCPCGRGVKYKRCCQPTWAGKPFLDHQ